MTEKGVSKEKLDAWLSSNDGQRAQRQWEGHHRASTGYGGNGNQTAKGISQTARSQARLDAAKGLRLCN